MQRYMAQIKPRNTIFLEDAIVSDLAKNGNRKSNTFV